MILIVLEAGTQSWLFERTCGEILVHQRPRSYLYLIFHAFSTAPGERSQKSEPAVAHWATLAAQTALRRLLLDFVCVAVAFRFFTEVSFEAMENGRARCDYLVLSSSA